MLGLILTSWVSLALSRPKQLLFREDQVWELKNGSLGKIDFSKIAVFDFSYQILPE